MRRSFATGPASGSGSTTTARACRCTATSPLRPSHGMLVAGSRAISTVTAAWNRSLSWAETHDDQLNENEVAFLAASTEQRDAERQREHQRVVRLCALLATVAVVAVLALIAGATALVQRRNANTAREQAELEAAAAMRERDRADDASADSDSQRRLAEIAAEESDIRRLVAEAPDQLGADEEVAVLMALEAYRRSASNATLGALQQVLVGLPRGWLGTMHGSMVYDKVSSSGDGSVVVATGRAGVDVFDLQTKRVLATFPHDDVVAVDVSADGSLVAAGSNSGDWWILSVPDLEVVDRGSGAGVTDLEFAPTGMALALGHVDGTVDVRDSSVSRTIGRLDAAVLTMAWRHDAGQIIAGGGVDQSARVFDAVAGGQVGNDLVAGGGGLTNGSTAVAFLADDAVVVNGPVVRFDVGSGDEIDRIDDVDVRVVGYVHPVGPDSLITIGQGGAVDLLDFGAGSTTRVAELGGGVGDATISNDRTLVTPWDHSLLITDLTGARVLASNVPLSFADRKTAAISDDGSVVVSGFNGEHSWWRPGAPPAELGRMEATYTRIRGNDLWIGTAQPDGTGMFQMWTAGGGLEPPLPSPGIVSTIGLSSDGDTVVLPAEPTRTVVHVMDRRSGETLAVLDEFTKAVPESTASVAKIASDVEFDPNGERMVVATIGGAWGVWDTDDWSLIRPIENGHDRIMDLDFSDDGRIVASITVFGELTIRDAADFTILAGPIAAHRNASSGGKAVSITNDGRLVVTDGDDGAKLWDIDTLEQIGSVFPDEAPVQAAELAKDANLLATVVGDDVVLWNVDTSSWFEIGCRAVARSMTRAEWDQFGPVDQPYVATCESVLAQI